jgi:hypothetical protein
MQGSFGKFFAPQIVDTVLKALRHNSAGVAEANVRA